LTERPYFRLGLTGYPLGHSLSPRLPTAALAAARLPGEYQLYPADPAEPRRLAELAACLRAGELNGLNVTIPHKQAILAHLDGLTPLAQRLGAVNTLYMEGGRLLGDNTDAPGFWADFSRLPGAQTPGLALVLGAGGSARAVTAALLAHGWQVGLAARRRTQAEQLLAELHAGAQAQAIDLTADALRPYTTPARALINTTPAGMHPHTQDCAWPDELPLPGGAIVYDLIYNPACTRLITRANAQGLAARSGLGMLIEQAALAFARWTGIQPPRAALWQAAPAEFVLSATDLP